MTPLAVLILLLSQVALVAGQLWLKIGMNATHRTPLPRRRIAGFVALGVAALTLWFFLWLGLFQLLPLSQVYPFEGLSPLLLVLGARLFLGERLPPAAWLGIALITLGVVLVGWF